MKLNHINLPVADLEAAALFLETYFGLRRRFNPEQSKDDSELILLLDDNELVCTLMQADRASFPGSFHIGFVQSSEQQVNEIYQRLQADGFQVKPPPDGFIPGLFMCMLLAGLPSKCLLTKSFLRPLDRFSRAFSWCDFGISFG